MCTSPPRPRPSSHRDTETERERQAVAHSQSTRHAFQRMDWFDKRQQYHWLSGIKSTVDMNWIWVIRVVSRTQRQCRHAVVPFTCAIMTTTQRAVYDVCQTSDSVICTCFNMSIAHSSSITIIIVIDVMKAPTLLHLHSAILQTYKQTNMYSKWCWIDWWALHRIHSVRVFSRDDDLYRTVNWHLKRHSRFPYNLCINE